MNISFEKLTSMLEEAFECGYESPKEMKKQKIKEILDKFNVDGSGRFRVWTVAELRKIPVGSIFEHITMGRGWVIEFQGKRAMQFQKNNTITYFSSDSSPWDSPMSLLEKSE